MRQLSGIDVSFLNMETATTYGHVASLNFYDVEGVPGGAGLEATKDVIMQRIDELAVFRRRLVEVPLGLDLPYWADDPDFDIDFHVRHHAVPPPGNPEQVAEVISRIIARPLDRSRPLWELYVIEGVDNGTKIAQLTKIHHATIDGKSGAGLLAVLLDTDPDSRPSSVPAQWTPRPLPDPQELLRRTTVELLRRPEKVLRLTVRATRELADATRSGGLRVLADLLAQPLPGKFGEALRGRLRGAVSDDDLPPALPPTRAPRTPWNFQTTAHRRFAYTTVSLTDAKRIRKAFDCTFNDVVMALCSGTLRRYLDAHDVLPAENLIAMVPVSLRTGDEDDPYQNRVSGLLADLGTSDPDPVGRLRRVQQSMARAKEDLKAMPADVLTDFTQFAPPAVAARAMRMVSRLRIADRVNPPFNVVISNVPGPREPLYSAGARLLHFYPVSTLADGIGLNMTVQSYCDNLDFGFVADRELVPDLWVMTDMLHTEMALLLSRADEVLAERQPPPARVAAKTRRTKKAAPVSKARVQR